MKEQIEFAVFLELEKKLEIKVGFVTHAEEVPKSTKLLKLTVEFGDNDRRTVVTNIKPQLGEKWHEELCPKNLLFITNLKPVTMMGIESTAMIMPGSFQGEVVSVNGSEGNILL